MTRADLPWRGPVVLVGFMAAGKSTVGPLLARGLGAGFVDLDAEVERRAGRSVAEIFRTGGEARFRELEAEATRNLDPGPGVVVAAGGGWMARPELRDRWPGAVRVWLRVGAAEVLRRVERIGERPLLDRGDPAAGVRRLLAAREPDYRRAEIHVGTDGRTPEEVAREVRRALEAGGHQGGEGPRGARGRGPKGTEGRDPDTHG